MRTSFFGRFFLVVWLKRLAGYYKRQVIARKMTVFLGLLSIWLFLLLGAVFSPNRQVYTKAQLATTQTFGNGTGRVELVSQTYSEDNGLLLLEFETSDTTSSVTKGINAKELSWKLYAKKPTKDMAMEVLPLLDNKIMVLVRQVPKSFDAIAIDIANETVNAGNVDTELTSSSSSQKKETGHIIQFFISDRSPFLTRKGIKSASQTEFALGLVDEEITFQEGQIIRLEEAIETLETGIVQDKETKESFEAAAQYLVGDELDKNADDILQLESDMAQKRSRIELSQGKIERIKEKIEALKLKKQDIEDGNFSFDSPIQTVRLE